MQHTWVMAGEFLRAAAEQSGYAGGGGRALAMAGHPDAIRQCRKDGEMLRAANMTTFANRNDELVALLEGTGDAAALQAATDAVIAGSHRDPEGRFYLGLDLAHFGREDRAVELLADAVDAGYFPYDAFNRLAWLDPLRHRTDFLEIMRNAEHRHREARAAFIDAGGEALLGLGV